MSKKTKYIQLLGGLPRPDWNQTDEAANDFIKNKPDEADALTLVAKMGLVEPTSDEDGAVYTDENNVIYTL